MSKISINVLDIINNKSFTNDVVDKYFDGIKDIILKAKFFASYGEFLVYENTDKMFELLIDNLNNIAIDVFVVMERCIELYDNGVAVFTKFIFGDSKFHLVLDKLQESYEYYYYIL